MQRREFIFGSAIALNPIAALGAKTKHSESWSTFARLPIKTQELYPAVHNGKLFVAGGIASKLGVTYFTDRVFSFDPATNQWSEETSLVENLHHAALVSCGNRLFVVGGFNGGYTHVWRMRDRVFELVDHKWVEQSTLPKPQAEGVLTCHEGQIHLVSGQSPRGEKNSERHHHIEVDTHLIWEPGSTQWESAAPIPLPRNSATGGWVSDQLVITGGRNSAGNFATTHIYDKKKIDGVKQNHCHYLKPEPLVW